MNNGWYRWAVVAMLWHVCLINYADRQAIFSVFEAIKDEMHLTDEQLGYVGSSFMWVYAAALPLAGLVGDRVNRKALILGGLVFWSLVTLATAWATEYWHLLACRALEGLGEAFYFPASMSMICDYHKPETRSRAMGLHQSSVYAGTVVGGTVAGLYAQEYGWQSGFILFGRLGLILAAILVLTLKEPQREQTAGPRHERDTRLLPGIVEVLRNRVVWVLVAAFIGANFVAMVFLTWLPSFLKREFKLNLAESGLNATIWLQTASVVGVLTGGWLADRWSDRRGGRLLIMAAGLFGGAPLIALIGWTLSLQVLVLAMTGFGFFKGLYDASLWASLFDVIRPERRATAQGLMNSIGWLGAGTAPIIIAKTSEHYGMGASLAATSMVYVVSGTLLLLAVNLLPPREPAAGISVTLEEVGTP